MRLEEEEKAKNPDANNEEGKVEWVESIKVNELIWYHKLFVKLFIHTQILHMSNEFLNIIKHKNIYLSVYYNLLFRIIKLTHSFIFPYSELLSKLFW